MPHPPAAARIGPGELNRRIADQEWGSVKNQAIKEKLKGAKWRNQMRRVVDECGLEPSDALRSLAVEASEEHRKRFFAVLTGFGDDKPEVIRSPNGSTPIACIRRGCRKGMRSTWSLALTAA